VDAERTPVLIGAGQWTERFAEVREAPTPLDSLEKAVRRAAADGGLSDAALAGLDTIGLLHVMAWETDNAPRLLAERIGAKPSSELQCGVGGDTGVALVNEIADRIRGGRARLALVAGTHNGYTRRDASRAGIALDWPGGGAGAPEQVFPSREGSSDLEKHYGLLMPSFVYPLLENARRARLGWTLEEHRAALGALFAPFTERAAANPHAWFPTARTAEELTTPTAENRMIVFPYTKYLNAVMETDQSAALLVCSEAAARELGVPPERYVYWHGGARSAEDPWFVSERPDLADCPSVGACARTALERAGVELADIAAFDLYSCFPIAVAMALQMLGVDESDPRDFSVAGGLPYAGGPGNGYTLHSAASMLEVLRAKPGSRGLVTGNGWYLTKHSAMVLGSLPPEADLLAPEYVAAPHEGKVELVVEASGDATIESYAIAYGRDGAPERGVIVGRDREQRRFLAQAPDDRGVLEEIVSREAIGREGRVALRDAHNRFELA